MPLIHLPPDVRRELSLKLIADNWIGHNWKSFAEEIGVTHAEIRCWDSLRGINPMENLFEWISVYKSDFDVADFKRIADKFDRRDVKVSLEEHGY